MDLIINALGVKLGKRTVLNDVSAHLRPGRVTAILGPNGAGKSTLVKAAAALVDRSTGSVRLDAQDVARMDARARARAIGYLPQDATVHWNIVARDVVALGRLPHLGAHAAPSPADRAAVERAMHDTETIHLADRPVGELSGGERARVLLGRVLAGEPRWLLADEPLASLDPSHQIDLLARLRGYALGGAGVAIVLHDLVQAQRAADDALLLTDGRLVAFGPVAEVMTAETLGRVFGVRVAPLDDGDRRLLVPVGRIKAA
ncbi:ABC transporter ATP-binding protein [Sphingomonas sp. CFBP 13603]|uniref:ABC transporter ATP-binding protein n=1 Tax=Sphingomonas sp. CFBP 13603 TaxID=2774040 RepID=UPI0018687336|nr:ABC transporter ATP-binding protein [Sphingomonas sp. CFBP 13603]MBE2993312.1 ABC transporter ATP-binding protein [Sphingomonas sp. CFBP 13603]